MEWWSPGFPVAGDIPKCGNRTDIPKAERRHAWVSLGTDTRNAHDETGFRDFAIKACAVCGMDRKSDI